MRAVQNQSLSAILVRGLGAVLASLAIAQPALAGDRWEEAGSGAVAILPVPGKAVSITGGSLVCAEQRWTLRLRADSRTGLAATLETKVAIDGHVRPVAATQSGTIISMPLDRDQVARLKTGTRLTISTKDKGGPAATFALRNSRKVIEAVAPRCSPVNMTGFDHVALSTLDPAVASAESLLAAEIKLFRQATTATPRLAAARIDRGGGRELLFASLCGSSWYYGRSGCTLFGYLRASPVAEWRQVYHTEGMALYVDPATAGDWPDLVTLEADGGVEAMRWRFDGDRYALRGEQIANELRPLRESLTP
jgi:hypothetical protein